MQPKEQTKGSSSKKSSTEKEMEAIEASKQALAEEGFYTISSGDEAPKKEDPKKKEESRRPYSANRQVRTLTTTSVTTRPRTIGTLTDYAYYLLKIGSATVQEANDMLTRIKPQEFIEITKPGMTKQLYANFTKFVGRRKTEGVDIIQELKEYKVSVPEFLIPGNEKYIDTSVAAKKSERKKKRKKAESTTTAESSPEERNELAQPLTRAVIQYIDEAGKEASFRIKFTQNMKVNTLARSIRKKRKLEGNTPLLRTISVLVVYVGFGSSLSLLRMLFLRLEFHCFFEKVGESANPLQKICMEHKPKSGRQHPNSKQPPLLRHNPSNLLRLRSTNRPTTAPVQLRPGWLRTTLKDLRVDIAALC